MANANIDTTAKDEPILVRKFATWLAGLLVTWLLTKFNVTGNSAAADTVTTIVTLTVTGLVGNLWARAATMPWYKVVEGLYRKVSPTA